MSREQGNIWPIVSVAGAAVLVFVAIPLAVQRQGDSRMATVDAKVTIGDTGSGSSSRNSSTVYRWPDSEVPRTAERLRDVTAVAITASTSVIEGSLRGKVPRDAKDDEADGWWWPDGYAFHAGHVRRDAVTHH